MNPTEETDYEFLHHLRDTLHLLGGRPEIVAMLKKAQDKSISVSDVDALRNYNIELLTDVKTRLANLNTLRIKVVGDENTP